MMLKKEKQYYYFTENNSGGYTQFLNCLIENDPTKYHVVRVLASSEKMAIALLEEYFGFDWNCEQALSCQCCGDRMILSTDGYRWGGKGWGDKFYYRCAELIDGELVDKTPQEIEC